MPVKRSAVSRRNLQHVWSVPIRPSPTLIVIYNRHFSIEEDTIVIRSI